MATKTIRRGINYVTVVETGSTSGPRIGPPSPDVIAKQDPKHTQRQFTRDLAKVSRKK